jgi:hypothetical protein
MEMYATAVAIPTTNSLSEVRIEVILATIRTNEAMVMAISRGRLLRINRTKDERGEGPNTIYATTAVTVEIRITVDMMRTLLLRFEELLEGMACNSRCTESLSQFLTPYQAIHHSIKRIRSQRIIFVLG